MGRRPLTPHGRHSGLIIGRRVAEVLAEAALDPASGLPAPVRAALAGLVLAVDAEAHRRAGVPLPDAGGSGTHLTRRGDVPAAVTGGAPRA